MLYNDKYKMLGRATATKHAADHGASPHAAQGNHELKPITLAILALIASPFFLVGIPLAHMALDRARQHPSQPRVAKALAIVALILGCASVPLVAFLAATGCL